MESAEIPPPPVSNLPIKKVRKNAGLPATDQQKANLRKGFDMMKAKRAANELVKAEKLKEKEERKAAGLPPIEEPPKLKKVIHLPPLVVEEIKVPEVKVKAPRSDKGVPRKDKPTRAITREEFDELRTAIMQHTKPVETEKIVEKEVVREVPVERIVEKERVITGKELLDRVFKFK
jgi:hypothetical protein